MSKRNLLNKLIKHVEERGINGLLPQNLPEVLLNQMNIEGDSLESDTIQEIPTSTLLLAVLHLLYKKKLSKQPITIEIQPTKLMEYFSQYIIALRMEDMRRKKDIEIPDNSLPTLENILDPTRKVKFEWLK